MLDSRRESCADSFRATAASNGMATADLLDRLRPIVDETIKSLAKAQFRIDPIGGARYSQQTSVVSSAYKRHGQLLEKAIRTRLADCEYFSVWQESKFRISDVADRAIMGRNQDIPDAPLIELPYGETGRVIQLDAVVFDKRISSLRVYEIKRGNGHFDAGKKRSLLRDTLCTQALLRSYGAKRGHNASVSEARVISYYGVKALPPPFSLLGDEMDDHFVFRVSEQVERVNDYFREKLYILLSQISAQSELDFDGLCPECPMKRERRVMN